MVKKIIVQQSIAETFNEYFVTIAENIRKQMRYTHMHVNNNDVDNHIQFINHAFAALTTRHPSIHKS
jgi:hypothetical protein